jgi:hypothetical protein
LSHSSTSYTTTMPVRTSEKLFKQLTIKELRELARRMEKEVPPNMLKAPMQDLLRPRVEELIQEGFANPNFAAVFPAREQTPNLPGPLNGQRRVNKEEEEEEWPGVAAAAGPAGKAKNDKELRCQAKNGHKRRREGAPQLTARKRAQPISILIARRDKPQEQQEFGSDNKGEFSGCLIPFPLPISYPLVPHPACPRQIQFLRDV